MSLFGLMGDFDDDLFGNHMNAVNMQMRSMNRLMNSLMPDPFNMLTPFDPGFQQNAVMERNHPGHAMGGLFGFPPMPNMNRLLSADIGNNGGASYSSAVISMSSGPDGRPQIYQATTSTKTGPHGVRETRKTVQDSTKGYKKMAIEHHIGERAHIIEKEQDLRSGQMEERQEFINLDEEQAEDFDREFINKAQMRARGRGPARECLTIEPLDDDDDDQPRHYKNSNRRQLPELPAPPQPNNSSSKETGTSVNANLTTATTSASNSTVASTPTTMSSSSPSSSAQRANASTNGAINRTISNNINYSSVTPRRAYRSHIGGIVTPRRPLRSPVSSPLTTTPTTRIHSTAVTPRDWRLYNPRFYRK